MFGIGQSQRKRRSGVSPRFASKGVRQHSRGSTPSGSVFLRSIGRTADRPDQKSRAIQNASASAAAETRA
jgi:hypothetical protein